MQTVIGVLIALSIAMSPWGVIAIIEHRIRVANRAAKRRDRIDRMVRQDIAWQSWCDACSRAITEGKPVPKWKEPS